LLTSLAVPARLCRGCALPNWPPTLPRCVGGTTRARLVWSSAWHCGRPA